MWGLPLILLGEHQMATAPGSLACATHRRTWSRASEVTGKACRVLGPWGLLQGCGRELAF